MAYNQFLEKIFSKFKNELVYYTHPSVQSTAHQVGAPCEYSWTKLLSEKGIISCPETIDRFIELERTLTSLYCLDLTLLEDYDGFTETQQFLSGERLSRENFKQLCIDVKETIKEEDFKSVLQCLITYSDLGKSPHTKELAKQAGIDPNLDTDDLILAILKLDDTKIISILPSFADLSDSAKTMLKQVYPLMTACLGHLYFLEGGKETVETIAHELQKIDPLQREKYLQLVFLAQLYDGIGSQGQLNMAGSVTCTNDFYKGYMLVHDTICNLEKRLNKTNSVEESAALAFEFYLNERAKWLDLDAASFQTKEDFQFVLRLACTLRIFDPKNAAKLKEEFYKLESTQRDLLTEQLSFNYNKGINLFARTPHYVATMAQNISRQAFKDNDIDKAIKAALNAEMCLALLIKEINDKYKTIALDNQYPLSFGKIALRATEPGFCNPNEFDASLAKWTLPKTQPTSKIKNLIFDLGHVFIRIDRTRSTVFRAFSQLTAKYGKSMSTAEIGLILGDKETKEKVSAFERGHMSKDNFRKFITKKIGFENVCDTDFDNAWCASVLANPDEVKQRLAYIDELGNQGYNIYILSNNNEIHRINTKNHYEADHWGQYFIKQYYSNETGKSKPDHDAFLQILKENRLKANETLFFDDLMKNVKSAWQLGIGARQFTVDHPITNIEPIINSFTQAEKSGIEVSRLSTLGIFAINKFKENAQRKQQERKFSFQEKDVSHDNLSISPRAR